MSRHRPSANAITEAKTRDYGDGLGNLQIETRNIPVIMYETGLDLTTTSNTVPLNDGTRTSRHKPIRVCTPCS